MLKTPTFTLFCSCNGVNILYSIPRELWRLGSKSISQIERWENINDHRWWLMLHGFEYVEEFELLKAEESNYITLRITNNITLNPQIWTTNTFQTWFFNTYIWSTIDLFQFPQSVWLPTKHFPINHEITNPKRMLETRLKQKRQR